MARERPEQRHAHTEGWKPGHALWFSATVSHQQDVKFTASPATHPAIGLRRASLPWRQKTRGDRIGDHTEILDGGRLCVVAGACSGPRTGSGPGWHAAGRV